MAGRILFANASLARRIEQAEASLVAAIAAAAARRVGADGIHVSPLAGGVAVYAGPGSPANKLAGLGFEGVPDEAALDAVEEQHSRRNAPLQVELSSLGDPQIPRLLARRGYLLVGFENVLGLSLDPETLRQVMMSTADGVTVTPSGPDEAQPWIDTVATAFLAPDVFDGPPSHESFDREALDAVYSDMIADPAFERCLARRDGDVAGGAGLRRATGSPSCVARRRCRLAGDGGCRRCCCGTGS